MLPSARAFATWLRALWTATSAAPLLLCLATIGCWVRGGLVVGLGGVAPGGERRPAVVERSGSFASLIEVVTA